MSVKSPTKETPAAKEKRLKSRKQTYKESYQKGIFFNDKQKLIEWLNQEDVIVRVHSGGLLDDKTEFIQITIEGLKP